MLALCRAAGDQRGSSLDCCGRLTSAAKLRRQIFGSTPRRSTHGDGRVAGRALARTIPGVNAAANALEVQKHSAANEPGASFPASMSSGAVQNLSQLTELLQLPAIVPAEFDHRRQVLHQPVEPGKGLPIRPSARLRSDVGSESLNDLGRVHRKVLRRAESAATASRLALSVSRATSAKPMGR